MAAQIDRDLERILDDVVMLGSFSPLTFHISIASNFAPDLGALLGESKATFAHEFGHLLHYSTSYFGLTDIFPWARTIAAITSLSHAITEESITEVARQVLGHAREKQLYSIDDEYYYEPQVELFPAARAARGRWSINEVTGSLFTIAGVLSNRRFWATRFFLEDGAQRGAIDQSFLRIPLGMRTALEHMAMSIDFMGEMRSTDPQSLSMKYGEQASEPELLHYFCLTHWVGPEMERKYGRQSVQQSYFVAGQLVSVLTEIPFNEPDIWTALTSYAKKHRLDLVPHMSHPHPSFIFPLIRHAAFKANIDYYNYDLDGMEARANSLLAALNLPSLIELRTHTDRLRSRVGEVLKRSEVGAALWTLLQWLEEYGIRLGWKDRLANPTRDLGEQPPVPLVFQDRTYLDGTILRCGVVKALAKLGRRREEMLRFPFIRDIVRDIVP